MNKFLLALFLLCGGASARANALLKPTTGATQALRAKNLEVKADINGAVSRVTATTIYANPNNGQIEADFIYSAPSDAVVTGFAYWFRGEKVIARVAEKERAAGIYQMITVRRRDPALVEMIGKNTFRARISPVEARADLKIEVQFAQTLTPTSSGWLWNFPLREETKDAALDEFRLRVRVAGKNRARSNMGALRAGKSLQVERQNFRAKADARVEILSSDALRHHLLAARDGGDDGFFTLSLAGKNAPRIRGIKTYDVVTKRGKNAVYTMGRYRGKGTATAKVGSRIIALNFGSAVEKNNVASLLWSAQRIENLSERDTNREMVTTLSKRFGMPSKWTSWLAVPSTELNRFKLQKAQLDVDFYGQRYAQLIANGQPKAAEQIKSQFEEADENLSLLTDYPRHRLQVYLNAQIDTLTYEQAEASPSRKRQLKPIMARLRSAGALPQVEVQAEYLTNNTYMQHLIGRWQEATATQKATSDEARALVKEMKRWQDKRMPETNVNDMIERAYSDQATQFTGPLSAAIRAGTEETPETRQLWREFREWQRLAGGNWGEGNFTAPYHERAHNRAYRLAETQSLSPNDEAQIARLQREVKANVEGKNRALSGGGFYYPYKPSDLKNMINVGEYTLKSAQARSKPENRYRPGDPLISVEAPADCRKIVAILPSGELLPLVYDASKKAWEARFDVPTYANEGAYKVKIIIVAADGSRQQMAMTFHVDVTAPDGKGGAIFGKEGLNLRLETDDQTDRVSAFTPWGQRIELRRDIDGIFVAHADVPTDWRDKAAVIRVVLTDEAHNRTEIMVDWNR